MFSLKFDHSLIRWLSVFCLWIIQDLVVSEFSDEVATCTFQDWTEDTSLAANLQCEGVEEAIQTRDPEILKVFVVNGVTTPQRLKVKRTSMQVAVGLLDE